MAVIFTILFLSFHISYHLCMTAEQVRCLYCEAAGARVVYPTSMEFHGGGDKFEKMIRGEHSLTNAWLIRGELGYQCLIVS
jgi:hypothetical protein